MRSVRWWINGKDQKVAKQVFFNLWLIGLIDGQFLSQSHSLIRISHPKYNCANIILVSSYIESHTPPSFVSIFGQASWTASFLELDCEVPHAVWVSCERILWVPESESSLQVSLGRGPIACASLCIVWIVSKDFSFGFLTMVSMHELNNF